MAGFSKNRKFTCIFMALLIITVSAGQLGADDKAILLEKRLINEIKMVNDQLDGVLGLAIKDLSTGRTILSMKMKYSHRPAR